MSLSAALRTTLGHRQGSSLAQPMLITTLFQARPVEYGSLIVRLGPKAWPSASVGFQPESL